MLHISGSLFYKNFILGSGTFATVEKGYCLGTSAVVKKRHTGTTVDVTNVFIKE